MNVQSFVTNIFKREMQRHDRELSLIEINFLRQVFDFDAIQQTVNDDIAFNGRHDKRAQIKQERKHQYRLKKLTKRFAHIVLEKYSMRKITSIDDALKVRALLECNLDIYPCEKKGF